MDPLIAILQGCLVFLISIYVLDTLRRTTTKHTKLLMRVTFIFTLVYLIALIIAVNI